LRIFERGFQLDKTLELKTKKKGHQTSYSSLSSLPCIITAVFPIKLLVILNPTALLENLDMQTHAIINIHEEKC